MKLWTALIRFWKIRKHIMINMDMILTLLIRLMTFMDMMITAISLMISMAEHLMNRCLRLIPCRNSRMMWFSGMVNLPAASPVNGLKQGIK